jgi:hypothetical protein
MQFLFTFQICEFTEYGTFLDHFFKWNKNDYFAKNSIKLNVK